MTELQKFNFKDNEVRIHKDEQGEPWFVAKDVASILGYSETNRMTDRLDVDECAKTQSTDSVGRRTELTIINESGLYSAIIGSNKTEAKAFKRWITHEVLPAIRKTGSYIAKELDPDTILATLYSEMEKRIKAEAERDQYRRNLERIANCSNLNFGEISESTGLPKDIVVATHCKSSSKPHDPQMLKYAQLVLPLDTIVNEAKIMLNVPVISK